MAMAKAKVLVGDAARSVDNTMKTLGPSFRRYMVNAWNDNLPKTPRVTRMPKA